MILTLFVLIPIVGGIIAWLSGYLHTKLPRWISLIALFITLGVALLLWARYQTQVLPLRDRLWFAELDLEWIPQLGINFHLAMDGLSLLLVLLTFFLGIIAVASSWTEINERVGSFHLNLMWALAGVAGVFISIDLFLFYFFWELMLVPVYFLIALWGHENRRYASFKFFIFTHAGGLLMLLSILGLYFIHGRATGIYTFNYMHLLGTPMSKTTALLLMTGFFIAFAIKLPVLPLHTWLPDAHTAAPTAGSIILAGLLLKTGAYGLLRFVVPLFPQAVSDFTVAGMALAVLGILYGAAMAFVQTDIKRLVAYTSISHMGFVLLGILAWDDASLQGAVLQIICHGISTGALFIIVGFLQERIHTREMGRMGGLWSTAPRMGAVALFFVLSSLGLPGLGNFIAEFLVLLGSYRVNGLMTSLAALGFIASTVYALWMIQRTFHGPNEYNWKIPDLTLRESAVMATMVMALVWLGLYPQPVFNTFKGSMDNLMHSTLKKAAITETGRVSYEEIIYPDGKGESEGWHILSAKTDQNQP